MGISLSSTPLHGVQSIQVYYVGKYIESAFFCKKSKGCQMLEKPLVMGVAAMHDLFI